MNINLNYIQVFCHLAQNLSFSATAKELNTSQPAISRKIKILEEELGFELFVRSNKTTSLTPKGQSFLDQVLPGFNAISGAIYKKEQKLNLKVGSIYEAGEKLLLPILGKLSDNEKINRFDLQFDSAINLFEKLQNGEVDIILTHLIPTQRSFASFEVCKDGTVLVGPAKNAPKVKNLVTYRITDEYTNKFLTKNFGKSWRSKFTERGSVNSHKAMLSLCERSDYFCVIPSSSFIPSKNLKIYKKSESSHGLYISTRENYIENIETKNVIKEMISQLKREQTK
ncbi:LysR family transcriptional regulator [Halobacteriovorax sp. DPLXC-1]|uniref:LysR family transcriptional regulator n=1 Tax=Halobacteriovorax sp. DPLXC-1 TaxID=3110771 RepID=UPI002FF19856